ncbi:FAD-linked oxidase [Variovorax sp. WS11]|uniref:FAD-binding oxidoreductase n=1 Tax=Variovorax sp. WS11 TaxID=1105204 RepID=UPI000D0CB005|nr:FAD-binding oxidoreductase [Variovorax sp. WS11]NDZ16537.1 FAD-binding oxidoreductase [Variovorax sp. WS11]PSL85888.1 FAD-linked oxidase [Variovorax sp. WS11]
MHSVTYLTLDKDVRQARPAELDAFAAQVSGGVLSAADADYDTARKVWNGTVDRRPALIARCLTDADVQAAARFAAAQRMLLSVRGGGHHIAGNAVAEGGLIIDLSGMRSIRIDAMKRTAHVAAGALLGDLDREARAHGLATPLGINSTTGVAGLTLGGGFGWLTRRHGMSIDNLLSATVVMADGSLRTASADSEPELFWALRGGGGNFGVVTSFEFRLHPVGPELYAGLVVYPFAQARQVLRAWRDFTAGAPDELTVWTVLRKAPPLPFLPAEVHGTEVVIFPLVYSGGVEEGERAAAPVTQFGDPLGVALGPTPYAGFQSAFDPLLAPGARNYWKSNNFSALGDAALDLMIEAAGRLPGPECEIFIAQLGGAMERAAPSATAFVGRDARYIMNVHGRWSDARDDAAVRAWARQVFQDVAPHATGSGYVNFLTEDEAGRVEASYGMNYPRLQQLKRRFDPGNLFRMNLNIEPAGGASALSAGTPAS